MICMSLSISVYDLHAYVVDLLLWRVPCVRLSVSVPVCVSLMYALSFICRRLSIDYAHACKAYSYRAIQWSPQMQVDLSTAAAIIGSCSLAPDFVCFIKGPNRRWTHSTEGNIDHFARRATHCTNFTHPQQCIRIYRWITRCAAVLLVRVLLRGLRARGRFSSALLRGWETADSTISKLWILYSIISIKELANAHSCVFGKRGHP